MIGNGWVWTCFAFFLSLVFVVFGVSLIGYDPALYPYTNISLGIPQIVIVELIAVGVIYSGLYPLYARIVPYGQRRRGFVITGGIVLVILNIIANFLLEILHHVKYFFITNWLGLLFILLGVLSFFILVYSFRRYQWRKYFA